MSLYERGFCLCATRWGPQPILSRQLLLHLRVCLIFSSNCGLLSPPLIYFYGNDCGMFGKCTTRPYKSCRYTKLRMKYSKKRITGPHRWVIVNGWARCSLDVYKLAKNVHAIFFFLFWDWPRAVTGRLGWWLNNMQWPYSNWNVHCKLTWNHINMFKSVNIELIVLIQSINLSIQYTNTTEHGRMPWHQHIPMRLYYVV